MQGFVPAMVAREILIRGQVRCRHPDGRLSVRVCVALAVSAFYELIEWWAALALGQGADEFLGTQGDPWDTQADMFLALIGAALALPAAVEDSRPADSARCGRRRSVQHCVNCGPSFSPQRAASSLVRRSSAVQDRLGARLRRRRSRPRARPGIPPAAARPWRTTGWRSSPRLGCPRSRAGCARDGRRSG